MQCLTMLQVMRNLPEKHQTLLFSATMPVEIEALAQVKCPVIFCVFLIALYKLYKTGKQILWKKDLERL